MDDRADETAVRLDVADFVLSATLVRLEKLDPGGMAEIRASIAELRDRMAGDQRVSDAYLAAFDDHVESLLPDGA